MAKKSFTLARLQQFEMEDKQSDRTIRWPGHPSPAGGEALAQIAISADRCLSRRPGQRTVYGVWQSINPPLPFLHFPSSTVSGLFFTAWSEGLLVLRGIPVNWLYWLYQLDHYRTRKRFFFLARTYL